MYSVALATGLALSLAASSAHADAIQSLSMADMSAAQFNSLFTPIDDRPGALVVVQVRRRAWCRAR